MDKRIVFILLIVVFFFGCERGKYEVIKKTEIKDRVFDEKMIDITTVIEDYPSDNVPEYTDRNWAIAVHSYNTGYTYYYDESNNFLGRRK